MVNGVMICAGLCHPQVRKYHRHVLVMVHVHHPQVNVPVTLDIMAHIVSRMHVYMWVQQSSVTTMVFVMCHHQIHPRVSVTETGQVSSVIGTATRIIIGMEELV
jgi:hypothetical protein